MAEDQQVFKRNIKEIDEVNDAIKTMQDRLKILNTRKKTLQSDIKVFMSTNKVERAITKKNTISLKKTKRLVPLKKKDFTENVVQFFDHINWDEFARLSSQQKAQQMDEYLKGRRTVAVGESLCFKKV